MTTGSEANTDSARLNAHFDAWLTLTGRVPAAAGDTVRLPMLSGSMHPSLPRGCTLRIAPTARAATGDVVVLARDGRLVAHRVLLRARWRGRTHILEMGDVNRRGNWRPETDVVGRVLDAVAADGAQLACPASRRRAALGLLRHLRGVLLGAPLPPDSAPEGKSSPGD